MTLQDLQTVDIPLNKLTVRDENVRTTSAEDGLDELNCLHHIRRLAPQPSWTEGHAHPVFCHRWQAPFPGALANGRRWQRETHGSS
jgi:hypothetical protein